MGSSRTNTPRNAPPGADQHVLTDQPPRKETRLLLAKFLTPLAAAIAAIILILTTGLYGQETENLNSDLIRIQVSAHEFYENSVRYDAKALRSIMDALKRDDKLLDVFARNDRRELYEYTATLFEDLRRDFDITHFYFTKPDRINLLRVHAPKRHSDKINRFTTIQAEQSGTIAYGVELGPLGTFTLRVVSPWYDKQTRELVGYVELGMETDRVLQKMRDFFGIDVIVAVRKEFLERKKWEAGMRALSRTPEWDRFNDVVLSVQSPSAITPELNEHYAQRDSGPANSILEFLNGDTLKQHISIPLQDAGGRSIAEMTLVVDVSREMQEAQNRVFFGSVSALVIGGLLIAFFYWQVGRVGRRIDHDEQELKRLASQDGLTKLYNRRMFNVLLNEEIDRSARYNRSTSLLMIDIDSFKHVNDTYGHQAGDTILKELSARLMREARAIDRVCRYGGEEMSIVLPETDAQLGRQIAERIRNSIESLPFDIGDGQTIPITVSIGVAVYPLHANAETTLILAADNALYAAKKRGRNRVCTHAQDD